MHIGNNWSRVSEKVKKMVDGWSRPGEDLEAPLLSSQRMFQTGKRYVYNKFIARTMVEWG